MEGAGFPVLTAAAVAGEVERTCALFGAAGRGEAAYMTDPTHPGYANAILRPHAGDRFKSDCEIE